MSINGVNATVSRIVGAITKGDLSAAIKALPEGVQRSFTADAGTKFKQITEAGARGAARFGDAPKPPMSHPEKVAAFLLRQTRNHPDDGDIGGLRETETALEVGFAEPLTGKILRAISFPDEGIGFRVPQFIIGAVEDADQAGCPLLKNPF